MMEWWTTRSIAAAVAMVNGIVEGVMPEWISVLLDDPFEDWRRRKLCGLQLMPEDQVRAIGYQAMLCFHCAMIS